MPIETTGIVADDTMKDYDDVAALLAGASNEQTNQARKVLTETDLAAVPAPDDTNNRYELDLPDITYTALAGNAISAWVVAFRPDTGSADSACIPLWAHYTAVTPDGNDVVLQFAATGAYRSA